MQRVVIPVVAGQGADRLLLAALWQHLAAAPQHSFTRHFAAVALQQPAWNPDRFTEAGSYNSTHTHKGSSSHTHTHGQTQDSSSHAAQQQSSCQRQPHAQSRLQQRQQQEQQAHDQQLHRRRSSAQLSAQDDGQLLQQHASLQTNLQHSNLQSTYFANVASLTLHPTDLTHPECSQLQGALALLSPRLLQQLVGQNPLMQQQQQQQQQHHQQQRQLLSELHDPLLHSLQQHQRSKVRMPGQAGVQMPQPLQPHVGPDLELQQAQAMAATSCSHNHFLQLAQAVVTALGLPTDSQPAGDDKLWQLLRKAAGVADCSSGSSRSNSSGSSSGSSSSASAQRGYSTSAPTLTYTQGLALALEATAKANHLRYKPLHDATFAAELARQLHEAYSSSSSSSSTTSSSSTSSTSSTSSSKVLRLLLSRRAMLWQHNSRTLPMQVLADLQRLIPGLADGQGLQLVVKQPRLLGCSSAQLKDVVNMLVNRLQLNQSQLAKLVLEHPQVLVQPVQQMVPNIGFLVGVGLSPGDLQAMAVGSPMWLTRPLRQLMTQWQFLQQVLKLGCQQDLVVFPQLLTLPIKSRLGPRVLYARKRNIKLLAPRLSAPHAGSTKAWRQHRMVPLNTWLSASDRDMCASMDLDLDDYQRFKQAWGRVEGVTWQQRGC